MRLYKLTIVMLALLLPTQVVLADNLKGHYQYGVVGSVNKAPAKTTNKLKIARPIVKPGKATNNPVANSGPTTRHQPARVVPARQSKIARPPASGPNLTVSIRYEHDVCTVDESPLGENIFNARCDVIVTVKNSGGSATAMGVNGGFKLYLTYFNYRGEKKEFFKYVSNLGVNQQKVFRYGHESIRNFKRSTSISADVDRGFIIPETNEQDNLAVLWLN